MMWNPIRCSSIVWVENCLEVWNFQEQTYGRDIAVWLIRKSHDLNQPICDLETHYSVTNDNSRIVSQFANPFLECAQFWMERGLDDLHTLLNIDERNPQKVSNCLRIEGAPFMINFQPTRI